MDRLRWALTGALWMAICVATNEAYNRWVLDALDASPASSEVFVGMFVLLGLTYLAIAIFGIGVMVAGWWVINRQGTTAAEPAAEARRLTS